ncbi:uncharacterized protein LOC143292894 isoform X2 [Babylonia areolata]|uniref:uncharacterized protein LOC143292894 isoform X2 n=1 Tax=Babylonia areolata TaxID=304850 RepID=UPI003FD4C3BA
MQKEKKTMLGEGTCATSTNISDEEANNDNENCRGEAGFSSEMNLAGDLIKSDDKHSSLCLDPTSSPSLNSVTDPSQTSSSSVPGSETEQTQQTTANSSTLVTLVATSAVSATHPQAVINQSFATTSDTTFIAAAPLSVSFADHSQNAKDSYTAMTVSTCGLPQLTVHDMDMRLVPLSAIGIMVGGNGTAYELSERFPCLTSQTPNDMTKTTGRTDTVAGSTLLLHNTVTVSPPSGSPSADGLQKGAEKVVAAVCHHPHLKTEQMCQCHCIVGETPYNDKVLESHNTSMTHQGDTGTVSCFCDSHVQQHWTKVLPGENQLQQKQESQTAELASELNNASAESSIVNVGNLSDSSFSSPQIDMKRPPCHSEPSQTETDEQRAEIKCDMTILGAKVSSSESSLYTKPDCIDDSGAGIQPNQVTGETQTEEMNYDTTSLATEFHSDDSATLRRSDCPNAHDTRSQQNHVTSETQTEEIKADVTSLNRGILSGDSLFSRTDRSHSPASQQPKHVTTETQTMEMKSEMTTLTGISSDDSPAFSKTDRSYFPDSHGQHNYVTTETQTVEPKLDVSALIGNSFDDSHTFPRSYDACLSDSLKQLNDISTEAHQKEMDSSVTSQGIENSCDDSSCYDIAESSDHGILGEEQSGRTYLSAVDKILSDMFHKEAIFVDSPVPFSFHKDQHDESSSVSDRKFSGCSLFGSETYHRSSNELLREQAKTEKEEGNDAVDGLSMKESQQQTDRAADQSPDILQPADCLPVSGMAQKRSFSSEDGVGSRDFHESPRLLCAQDQQNDKSVTERQLPLNSSATNTSLCTKHSSSENNLSENLHAVGESETFSLSGLPFSSSINSHCLVQSKWAKPPERLDPESETEKSVVSASVQVSLSGTSEHKRRSSRSHRRRSRAREEGSTATRKSADLSQSQTSYSSSSVDSLLSLSDSGSGSSYRSDVLNYLTSYSHSQGQVQRSVNKRRLKKLLTLLRLSDQQPTSEVSGLSDFSRTVADLQHLCLCLSRNLELQTQQQLLEQQQQRLREHQQQLVKEQTPQDQHPLQEKEKHPESKEPREEPHRQVEVPQQGRDQQQQNQLQEQQEQQQQQPEEERVPHEEGGGSGRPPVKDQLHTKRFLKLRLLSQPSQKRGVQAKPFKGCPRPEEKSPKPQSTAQQAGTSSRFQPLALSATEVNPDVLIEEACKNTELLERLGVDKDVFRTDKEVCSEDVPQQASQNAQGSPKDSGSGGSKEVDEGGKVEEGERVVVEGAEEMETPEEAVMKLDEEFDKMLADMKPHVLKLPHKSDRQKCAVWIKKLCEPPSSGITGRKNRNMYCQLMLHMLKRGSLQDPFDKKPGDGPLLPLPSYMSIYFDEPLEKPEEDAEKLPDWVEGELGESVGSSLFRKSEGLGNPAATSTWVSNAGSSLHGMRQRFNAVFYSPARHRPHTSMGITLDKDPGLSPIRGDHRQHTGYSADDVRLVVKSPPPRSRSPTDRERRQLPDVRASRGSPETKQSDMEWTRPLGVTASSTTSFAKGTLYHDETSIAKPGDKEIALRTKMIEAKYHEEKLRLQQKHDTAVQKILDRKNSEIEDVKSHYRSKTKELEETITKLERKVQTLVKEAGVMRETKDKQISELKKMVEDSSETQRNEYEKRIHDMEADFEQQKFELQKLHTRNIQEILDDTNARLQRMDAEYNQQAASTTSVIKDLESRVQQLMGEVDRTLSQRSALEKEKAELASTVDKLTADLDEQQHRNNHLEREYQKKLEASEHEMRTLRNKTEASLEFLKQEQSIASAKAADTISDLEQQVDYLKKALKDAEEQRQRQMRETEQVHQQDKLHLENLHDKQIRSMKKELEQLEQEMQRKLSRLEQLLHDKEGEVQKQKEAGREQAAQAEKSLEEFKLQVEKNQANIYADMRQQMEQVEADLKKSKQAREKQSREYTRQLDEVKYKHEHELTELKMNFDNEKAQLLHEVHLQKEYATTEHEREMEQLREAHRNEIKAIEARFRERQEKDAKVVCDLEGQVGGLREDLVQSNQLRKQQLVELGLLREEEKQKMQRDHEAEMGRLRGEGEQQRLELQKMHSIETEKLLEKTNDRLKTIEREYMERGKKSSETITELQNSIKLLRDDIKRAKEAAENRVSDVRSQSEEEKLSLKKQYTSNLSMVQHELESQRSRCHNLDRQMQKMEADHEEKMTRLKLDHEDRIRGLLPGEMKQELEDTIGSLKSQVGSLQQRAAMLQEELDMRLKNPLGTFASCPPSASTPIKSSV